MDSKHYRNGSDFPPLRSDGVWRVYGMRYCPFVHRTVLVLEHKQIPYEAININLSDKPSWFLERSPTGKVPVLERGDQLVFDSTICDYFLEEAYPEHKLLPSDPYNRAQVRMLMELYSKVIVNHYALRRLHKDSEKCAEILPQFLKDLQPFENALTDKYFGGQTVGLLDFHMWPYFERMSILDTMLSKDIITESSFPRLYRWMKDMYDTAPVKRLMHNAEVHMRFAMSAFEGSPIYDF